VHHCGVDGTRPRGHTSLTGAADVQLSVTRDTLDNVVTMVECAKDGPQGAEILSRLEVVEVGVDEDGDGDGEVITSCVVAEVDASAPRLKLPKKLIDRQRLALRALDECTIASGKKRTGEPAIARQRQGSRGLNLARTALHQRRARSGRHKPA
jgi:hypothetical protein